MSDSISPVSQSIAVSGKPRILFTSVFGPYGIDDEHGSRAINPMELYHNQVTRLQGPFSLRMFHRSWGLMLLKENLSLPSALLDFPTFERFEQELKDHPYDYVAISAIPPNLKKVIRMCEKIRELRSGAKIILGGHIAGVPKLAERTGADFVVRGEGISWMRQFFGEDPEAPIRHPRILSGVGARTMGIRLGDEPGGTAATLIPSVGCPMGCNFCATSAAFGGKGKFSNFYETGDELFEVMTGIERDLGVRSFFVMDENFLLHKKRALRLLELMKEHDRSWSLYVFSSANVLRSYRMEQLVELGISWVWMGIEGKDSRYTKLDGADTLALVRDLRAQGISVLGSTIIGLEEHTPENLPDAIEHAVAHDTEFHQFMLYTPVPGTPLYEEHRKSGTLTDPDCEDPSDAHGQLRFMHLHPNIPAGVETEFLHLAFRRDFEANGPSVMRMARTALLGWKKHSEHPDPRVRRRVKEESRMLPVSYAAALSACALWFGKNAEFAERLAALRKDLVAEFGLRARLASLVGGPLLYLALKREAARMARGVMVEPPTFYTPLPA